MKTKYCNCAYCRVHGLREPLPPDFVPLPLSKWQTWKDRARRMLFAADGADWRFAVLIVLVLFFAWLKGS